MRATLLIVLVIAGCGGASSSSSGSSTSSSGNIPSSDPCANRACPDGEHCELQDVQCIQAPCDPVPACVTGTHPCAAILCDGDSRCEARNGRASCVPAPVATGATPASGGVPCGNTTCAEGRVCCNASCGICTPPDGMCTQQFCN
jgi:hypothetical protein